MGFSRQECWSCLPFPPPGDLPNPGVEHASPVSPAWQADSLPLSHQELPFCKMGYHLTQLFLYTYKRKHGPQIISKPYFVHWVHGVITGSGETGIVDWSCLRLWTCFSYVFDGFKFTRNCKGNTLISFLGLYRLTVFAFLSDTGKWFKGYKFLKKMLISLWNWQISNLRMNLDG